MPDGPNLATLWLPLSAPRIAWTAAAVTFVLYALAMARGLAFYDTGELAVAAVQLGLSHPPGQPLYSLLGALFAHVPFVPPLVGLNLFSALCGALTMLPALSLAESMTENEPGRMRPFALCVALALGVLAQHATLWEHATRIEVYALAILLALWALARLAYALTQPVGSLAWLALGGVLGACASVNPVIAAFAAAAGAPGALVAMASGRLPWSRLVPLIAGAMLGLLPYGYVPWVGARTDRLVWGAPSSGVALYDFLSARDFRVNLGVSPARWLAQGFEWLGFSSSIGLLPLLVTGVTAHLVSPPRALTRLAAPIAVALVVLYLSSYAVFRPDLPDCVSYAGFAAWLSACGVAALLAQLWNRISRVAAVALGLAICASVLVSPPGALSRTRHLGDPARELAQALLESAPVGALLVVGSDHWVAPLWYLQEVEGQRPDVAIVATGLLSSSWYFEHLFRRHPDLVRAPLVGPGGRMGRLSRLLQANAQRALVFEFVEYARAFKLETCVGPVLLHARVACSAWPAERTRYTDLLARLRDRFAAGEPTVLGVLAQLSLERGRSLFSHGFPQDGLRALFAGVPREQAELDVQLLDRAALLPAGELPVPRWQHETALGDPARNLFLAALVALEARDLEHAVLWMLGARDMGLPEAATWVARMERQRTP